MPRYRRHIRPGDLVHVILRFVNRDFRLSCDHERDDYLRRLAKGLAKSDWHLIAYALMSSHIHLTMIAGRYAFDRLCKSTHAPFARWLNDRQGRLGPLFAERPLTIITPPIWTGRLVAYLHNNPKRGSVVSHARESTWTSHRAYMDPSVRPGWLDASLGLELMGYGDDSAGRNGFEQYVGERADEPRDIALTGAISEASRLLRQKLEVALTLEHPSTGPDGLDYRPRVIAPRWGGEIGELAQLVAGCTEVHPPAMCGRSRHRGVVAARRLVALLGRELGCTNVAIGLYLGISEAAVRQLTNGADRGAREQAGRLLLLVA